MSTAFLESPPFCSERGLRQDQTQEAAEPSDLPQRV